MFFGRLLLFLIQIRKLIGHGHIIKAIYVTPMTRGVMRVVESAALSLLLLNLSVLHDLLLLLQTIFEFLFLFE